MTTVPDPTLISAAPADGRLHIVRDLLDLGRSVLAWAREVDRALHDPQARIVPHPLLPLWRRIVGPSGHVTRVTIRFDYDTGGAVVLQVAPDALPTLIGYLPGETPAPPVLHDLAALLARTVPLAGGLSDGG